MTDMGNGRSIRTRLVDAMAGRGDLAARALLAALRLASGGFYLAYQVRRAAYGIGLAGVESVGVPVISVGNLTAGGTGKTPMTIFLARRLGGEGLRIAVLRRGYGARDGRDDEETLLIRRAVPGLPVYVGRDRIASAKKAVRDGADCLLLDDGFQHWRLARDLDVVLIDATCPFGFERLLPGGLLREPPSALRRAGAIAVTRADIVSAGERRNLLDRVSRFAPGVPVAETRHRPGVPFPIWKVEKTAAAPADLAGLGVLAVSAIGNHSAFARTLIGMGARVIGEIRFEDHHLYTEKDVEEIERECRRVGADSVVVTEKDAVKLADLPPCRFPALALPVEIEFISGEDSFMAAVRSAAGGGGRSGAGAAERRAP